MKAIVNDGCIGCGLCEELCPEAFRIKENGLAEGYGEVTPDLEDSAKEARDNCPVNVIEIEE